MYYKIISTDDIKNTLTSFKLDDHGGILLYVLALFHLGERKFFTDKSFIRYMEYGLVGNRQAHTSFISHPLTKWWLSLPADEIDFAKAKEHVTFYILRDAIQAKIVQPGNE